METNHQAYQAPYEEQIRIISAGGMSDLGDSEHEGEKVNFWRDARRTLWNFLQACDEAPILWGPFLWPDLYAYPPTV